MSEKTYKLDYNGQQVQKQDFETLGFVAGHADDKVFAEALRLAALSATFGVKKCVIPHVTMPTQSPKASGVYAPEQFVTPAPTIATGSIAVGAFRAVVGARVAPTTDARLGHDDIRSAVFTGDAVVNLATTGNVTNFDDKYQHKTFQLAANASGNPRWDLVYALVVVDANSSTTTRKVKDPLTLLISSQTVSTTNETTVTVAVSTGTPSATPALPSLPADAGTSYYIPLAYVRVPTGFNATSTVAIKDIMVVAPIKSLKGGTSPGTVASVPGGSTLTSTQLNTWATTGNRPRMGIMPPTAQGGVSKIITISMPGATLADWSHRRDDVIDDSIDWRNRLTRWTAQIRGTSTKFPFDYASGLSAGEGISVASSQADPGGFGGGQMKGLHIGHSNTFYPSNQFGGINPIAFGVMSDQWMRDDTYVAIAAASIFTVNPVYLAFYVDTFGRLCLDMQTQTNPNCSLVVWLDASAPIINQ